MSSFSFRRWKSLESLIWKKKASSEVPKTQAGATLFYTELICPNPTPPPPRRKQGRPRLTGCSKLDVNLRNQEHWVTQTRRGNSVFLHYSAAGRRPAPTGSRQEADFTSQPKSSGSSRQPESLPAPDVEFQNNIK